jgi:hypothetical protein
MKFKKSNTKKDRRDSLSRRREKILNEVGVIPGDQRSLESGWETFFLRRTKIRSTIIADSFFSRYVVCPLPGFGRFGFPFLSFPLENF